MNTLCARHNQAALTTFGNTAGLAYLVIEVTALLFEEPTFRAAHEAAVSGEPLLAERDARARRRIQAKLGVLLEPLGPLCCLLGENKMALATVRAQARAAQGPRGDRNGG